MRATRALPATAAALLLPFLAAADSHLQTGASGGALRATAHLDFKIIIPQVLSMDVANGEDRVAGAKTVAIFSNSRNVTLAASARASDQARGNVILSAAARKVIRQNAACTLAFTRLAAPLQIAAAGAQADAHRVVCTASMP